MPVRGGFALSLVAVLCLAFIAAPPAAALLTEAECVRQLIAAGGAGETGEPLFAESFAGGALSRWRADAGWSVIARDDGPGNCARVVASEKDHEDLILKQHIPVTPGHPIAVFWQARTVSGQEALYLRVDYFDAEAKTGTPYARQQQGAQGAQWTQNALLISEWFPPYTRAITLHFHHSPKAATTTLLGDVRVVDLSRPVAERRAGEIAATAGTGTQLLRDAAALPASPANDYWKRLVADRVPALVAQFTPAAGTAPLTPERMAARDLAATSIQRLSDVVAGLREGKPTAERLAVYTTRPVSSEMILPHTARLAGHLGGPVDLGACRGEYEPASIVVWAPEAIPQLTVSATDLTGPDGAIPASAVDIKWVKCWFQGGNAPYGIGIERTRKALIPELLLNDDTLVRVDLQARHNELRLSFPAGARYVGIDDPTEVRWGLREAVQEYPVQDSPHLVPLDLPAEFNKQVWVTVHVPAQARPGRYAGHLRLASGGRDLGTVELIVRVLPFDLAAPKTHYDLSQDYTGSLYYWGELDAAGEGTIGYKYKREPQLCAELAYMFEHGIVAPAMIWSPTWVYGKPDFFRRHLELMRAQGMAGRPLYMADSGLIGSPTSPEALAQLKRNVEQTIRIAREAGFTDVYFYGIDEAQGDVLNSQRKAWEAVHAAGGKVLVSGYQGHLAAVGDILDLLNWAGRSDLAQPAQWHQRGHKIWNYANPQTPVEDPLVYRRNYGLLLWGLDFDGACTYCFMDSEGRPWNDFDGHAYRDHIVAYPTVDGVVATLALQGFREGIDDVRYATTLRLAIDRALKGDDAGARRRATEARAWLDGLRSRAQDMDLDEVRERLVQELVRLQGG